MSNQQPASVTTTTTSAPKLSLMPEFVTEAFLTLTVTFRTLRKTAEGMERIVESTDQLATRALAIKQKALLEQLEAA
jgi:hypothetical protein